MEGKSFVLIPHIHLSINNLNLQYQTKAIFCQVNIVRFPISIAPGHPDTCKLGSPTKKKSPLLAFLMDFVQIRWGALPKFFGTFS